MLHSLPALVARHALILAILVTVGWFEGYPVLAAALGGWGLVAWHIYQLHRLEAQLSRGRELKIEDAFGLWSEVYSHLYRLLRQQEQRERALRNTLGKFREAVGAVPDAAVALDEGGEVIWANHAAEQFLGLKMPQDSGRRLADLVRYPGFVAFLNRQGEDGIDFPAPADHSQTLHARLIPYGHNQHLLIASDVTRMQRLEQVRRDFVANVSHELRTPLTVINGYLETLIDSEDPSLERWQRPLHGMRQQSARMLHIIEDLLLLSRLEGTGADKRPEQMVCMARMLEDLAEEAQELSGERGHQIECEIQHNLYLLGCEKELRSACSNLIFNAVRHTPPKTRIIVRWASYAQGPCLEVQDFGEGIPAQHLPRLSERFYRVDKGRQREGGGTGLGLAIVKHVLQRHGAQLLIRSELGRGSCFSAQFPLERAKLKT